MSVTCLTASASARGAAELSAPLQKIPQAILDTQNYGLAYRSVTKIKAGAGTKSVLFNARMNRLYALNLEGLSIYEYAQSDKKLARIFKFKGTPGTGWDYDTDKPIKSLEEKPVEACFSSGDSVLWVSLHNAEGIVPIFIGKNIDRSARPQSPTDKAVYLLNPAGKHLDTFYTPLIRTGKTPKVIARTADDRKLFVSNWHSNTVSVLDLDYTQYPYARLDRDVPMTAIPRGLSVDDARGKTYVAIMGGASLAVIDNDTRSLLPDLPVASNPRHLVMDRRGRVFVSYNKIAKVACLDPLTGRTLFTAPTPPQPRTIALSKNGRFLFVTCYSGEKILVLEVMADRFREVTQIECKGSPVGIDIFEDKEKLEAWVCTYSGGQIMVYTFDKTVAESGRNP
jgi:sugar lactone lactonase YvrE